MTRRRRCLQMLVVLTVLCCARGPAMGDAPPGRYSVTSLVVKDNRTGLEWQRFVPNAISGCADSFHCSHSAAQSYCQNLVLDGTNNWRLPSLPELLTIMDPTLPSPALDRLAFPNASGCYWSSSPVVKYPGLWWVGCDGDSGFFIETPEIDPQDIWPVRCVR